MKKQDILTLVGMLAGFGVIIYGMLGGGGTFGMFIDMPSVAITIGGSFCALLVNYPADELKRVFKVLAQSFKETSMSGLDIVSQFGDLSKKARREGLLSLEDDIEKVKDDYLRKGLQMVVDGIEPETIREILELEIGEMEKRHKDGADVLKAWAGYAPAFGMLGTLIGLIQMLANLDDPGNLGPGMSKALITTFYGSLIASLILNPMAANLMYKSSKECTIREMMLEGVLAIQSGVNPRIVEEKLVSYLNPVDKKIYQETQAASEVETNV
ncbi:MULTISPECIES: motility protein A [Clostridium]|uniref:Chemotaxis motA protein n=1 Tax=Clostridium novyi (strain NT) TaxID=386415 RepID=A0Q033_CLONN|nr:MULTISPECIES: motility protein A [Clostridium]ABK60868.1 chemotaxis motA protein [Clostridium novyi NT]KEH86064.1 flagellar motor protein MotP [Clostridium novyi A str. NCTC 538]KEH87938.1 flagellar motor protein MotP [Clostridium novyi A str. 4540]KEH88330.1 flagellar motor protein MotP [Clostridium novyi A str. BKT29909]KEH93467.1 flagellar motor protein MotP [Clostridium botulinum C/D str. It1]